MKRAKTLLKLNQNGFGLLDVITSTAIITIGMIGILAFVIQSNQAFFTNRSRLTAIMLAQEGIELVRNTRDSNWKAGVAWDANIAQASSYRIDIDGILTTTNSTMLLKKDSSDNTYQYTAGTNTLFYRNITTTSTDLNSDGNDDELQVVSLVRWTERGRSFSQTIETFLYDWKE